jgi:quercetin 2,3-dioxygenase
MSDAIIDAFALPKGPWPTLDPFLFCVHHDDRYPPGADDMGPKASLAGRQIGQDFSGKDGWNMYHGERVPGFPQHPHRGFETVTVARHGYIDHSDSLGARARFGEGDLQWMTAGRGVVHSEMFPLLRQDAGNPTELFQIWLNLPARSKMAEPHFAMFWRDEIPRHELSDAGGREIVVTTYAKTMAGQETPPPPPASWAASEENKVGIWTVQMAAGAKWTLPAADAGCNRRLYFFRGESLILPGGELPVGHGVTLAADASVEVTNGAVEGEFLVLEGRPIGEPVAQHGPFVMNTRQELQQAFQDYNKTQFGGWRWADAGPAHPRDQGRFAEFPDGKVLRPGH